MEPPLSRTTRVLMVLVIGFPIVYLFLPWTFGPWLHRPPHLPDEAPVAPEPDDD